jgi:hypothetical protein
VLRWTQITEILLLSIWGTDAGGFRGLFSVLVGGIRGDINEITGKTMIKKSTEGGKGGNRKRKRADRGTNKTSQFKTRNNITLILSESVDVWREKMSAQIYQFLGLESYDVGKIPITASVESCAFFLFPYPMNEPFPKPHRSHTREEGRTSKPSMDFYI